MFKVIATIATAIAALFMFAGTASADVISQSTSEESHQKTSSEGTSNNSEDHMSNSGPGIIMPEGPTGTLQVVGHRPVFNADGTQQFHADGITPVMLGVFGWVPFTTGPAPATIVHN